ncbi:MAG: hypothetical protein P8R42_13730 [Candidatus Binatia bacterium]|nr:hypothetical protein [Candidatus Binatia bacterium]
MKASIHLLSAALLFTVACGDSSTDANLLGDNPNNETVTTVQCDTRTKDVNQYTQVRCYPYGTDPVDDGYCALSTWETPCELFPELPPFTPPAYIACTYLTRLADKAHSNADVCQKVLGEPWRSADHKLGRVELVGVFFPDDSEEESAYYDIFIDLTQPHSHRELQSGHPDVDIFCYSASVTGDDDPNPRYEPALCRD